MIASLKERYLKSKVSKITALIVLMLPFVDALVIFHSDFWNANVQRDGHFVWPTTGETTARAFDELFLVGRSEGHVAQMILLWLLPIWLFIILARPLVAKRKETFVTSEITRTTRRQYWRNYMCFSFVVGFGIMLIGLIINFIFVWAIWHGGTDERFQNFDFLSGFNLWQWQHPYVNNFMYMLLASVISGATAQLVINMCFVFKKAVPALSVTFAIWMVLWLSGIGLPSLMQTQTTVDIVGYIASVILVVVVFTTSAFLGYCQVVKRDLF